MLTYILWHLTVCYSKVLFQNSEIYGFEEFYKYL